MSITADTIAYSSLRSKDHHKIIYSLVSKVSTDAIDKFFLFSLFLFSPFSSLHILFPFSCLWCSPMKIYAHIYNAAWKLDYILAINLICSIIVDYTVDYLLIPGMKFPIGTKHVRLT